MKKAIALVLVVIMAFSVASCKKNAQEGPTTPTEKYVFQSNDKQKVYKNSSNYMLFYYGDDGTISGIDVVQTFPSEEVAESSLEIMKKTQQEGEEIVREGKYIVTHKNKNYLSDFKKMNAEGLESFLKAQGYVLVEKVGDETTTNAPAKTTAKPTEKTTAKPAEKTTAKPAEKTTAAAKK